jgi:hypothetical protein
MLTGIVTLSEIGPVWTINQQAKSLKSLAPILVVVPKFRSVGLNVTTPPCPLFDVANTELLLHGLLSVVKWGAVSVVFSVLVHGFLHPHRTGIISSHAVLGGLHHHYVRV